MCNEPIGPDLYDLKRVYRERAENRKHPESDSALLMPEVRLLYTDRKELVTQIFTCYKQVLQKSTSERQQIKPTTT